VSFGKALKSRFAPLSVLGACVLGGVAVACQEPTPERITVETPELILSAEPVKALVWAWYPNDTTRRVGKGPYQVRVEPPDLANATQDAQLACLRSGDGQLTVSVGGATAQAPVRCRLVDQIRAPELGRVELTAGTVQLDVAAFTKEGQRLDDVLVSLSAPNANVVRTTRDKLEPVQVGRAKLQARAGDKSTQFEVEVVRRIEREALPMNDNTRIHVSLDPGTYELVVPLSEPKPLNIEWRSAPYCNTKSAASKEHKSVCTLRAKGGVVFDNPNYLLQGTREVSRQGYSLFEVPLE
jgi:hypothetical protein